MVIALVLAICVVLLVLALLAPRLSNRPQRGVDRAFSTGGRVARKAPWPARAVARQAVRCLSAGSR